MADPVELDALAQAPETAVPHARELVGEELISRLLRTGAVLAGLCFAGSIALALLPPSAPVAAAIDVLRKGGVAILVATPVVRLVAAGVLLGVRGEWRYTVYAASILLLLTVALSAGLAA